MMKLNQNQGVAQREGNELPALKRILGYILKNYKFSCLVVVIGIIVSAVAKLFSTLFMQMLIDDYIVPMTQTAVPDYGSLAQALCSLAAILLVGTLFSWVYNRIMVNVSQGTMKRLRTELFTHMESLPIKYFDTHAHGDIMSVYTNDVDTLRQSISQSLPQLLNSGISLITTFFSMIVLDIPLTIVSVIMVFAMVYTTSKISGISSKYFVRQQADLGAVNGYIEEMMEGQKVVKVFCHEEKTLEGFRKLNEQLRKSADSANKMVNIIMPVNNNLGNISYVLCAVVGGLLAVNGYAGLTIGTLVAFLNLNKNFTQPITQISQQLSSIIMAGAGAGRVFQMIDEESEKDFGYVELVNVTEEKDGALRETPERTRLWAWKHPHKAEETVTYRQLLVFRIFKRTCDVAADICPAFVRKVGAIYSHSFLFI